MALDRLIESLVADAAPVRRIASPASRLGLWLLVSVPVALVAALLTGLRPDLAARLVDPVFFSQMATALLCAVVCGYAALCAGLPDQPGWKLAASWASLGLWSATLGRQCWETWLTAGWAGLRLQHDAACLPTIAALALVPALTIVALLRRGVAVRRFHALFLGALAAGSLADVSLRLCHRKDAALTVIVWQLGSVLLFSLAASAIARRFVPRGGVARKNLASP